MSSIEDIHDHIQENHPYAISRVEEVVLNIVTFQYSFVFQVISFPMDHSVSIFIKSALMPSPSLLPLSHIHCHSFSILLLLSFFFILLVLHLKSCSQILKSLHLFLSQDHFRSFLICSIRNTIISGTLLMKFITYRVFHSEHRFTIAMTNFIFISYVLQLTFGQQEGHLPKKEKNSLLRYLC